MPIKVNSPWFIVGSGIAGLIVGYTVVTAMTQSTSAKVLECPVDQAQHQTM